VIAQGAAEHSVKLPKAFIDLSEFGERFRWRHGQTDAQNICRWDGVVLLRRVPRQPPRRQLENERRRRKVPD
jgi:hypothetical protein